MNGSPDTGSDAGSDAALYAWLAARVDGIEAEQQLADAASAAGLSLSGRSLRTVPRRSRRLQHLSERQRQALSGWTLSVPLQWLDLFEAVVRLVVPSDAADTQSALAEIPGILEAIETRRREIWIVRVGYERRSDQVALESRLAELGEIREWDEVRHRLSVESDFWRRRARVRLSAD